MYTGASGFEEHAEVAIKKMGKKAARLYVNLREFVERGDAEALERARALAEQQNLSIGDAERLFGYLEGNGRIILSEPQSLLAEQPKMPGLDGEKMSKSYNNYISLREAPDSVEQKIRTMQTDPRGCAKQIRATRNSVQYMRCIRCIRTKRHWNGPHKAAVAPPWAA